jgi:hypothetical protein
MAIPFEEVAAVLDVENEKMLRECLKALLDCSDKAGMRND